MHHFVDVVLGEGAGVPHLPPGEAGPKRPLPASQQQLGEYAGGQGFRTLLRGVIPAVSASALWVDFDGHQAVTVTMDHLPGAVLSPVDRRRSQPHFPPSHRGYAG